MKPTPTKPAKPVSSVSDPKARCLGVIEEVRERGAEYVVTKRGQPLARLLPFDSQRLEGSPEGMWVGRARSEEFALFNEDAKPR